MAGSSFSGGSFNLTGEDGSIGLSGFLARLNTASNGAGLQTPVTPGAAYAGATVMNRNATQWVRATVQFVVGAPVPVAGDLEQIVPPNGSISFSFDGDVIESITVQVVTINAAGTVAPADGLVAAPAVVGTVDVAINFVNA